MRIPPVAALTDRPSDGAGARATRRRLISGTALTVFGVALLAIGLAKPVVALVGVGAVCIFVGVAMLAPAIARPLSGVLGRPLAALLGTPGRLGRENSMRSPRRTAQTASALMVGLALVSAMAVFGASLSESATSSVDQAISADLLVSANGSGQLSDAVPATAAAVPGVTSADDRLPEPVRVQVRAGDADRGDAAEPADYRDRANDGGLRRRPRPGRAAHRLHDREGRSPVGRGHGAGEVRVHRLDHHQDRRDLPVQRSYPELPGQLRATSSPTSGSRIRARSCCAPTAAPASRRPSRTRWRRTRTCRCRPGRSSSRLRWRTSTSSSAWSTPCWRWRC